MVILLVWGGDAYGTQVLGRSKAGALRTGGPTQAVRFTAESVKSKIMVRIIEWNSARIIVSAPVGGFADGFEQLIDPERFS
jgi:hypothetical protein